VGRCMASSTRYSRTLLRTEAAARAPTILPTTAVRECDWTLYFVMMYVFDLRTLYISGWMNVFGYFICMWLDACAWILYIYVVVG